MNCDECNGMIEGYLKNELSAVYRGAVEAHLATCHTCKQRVSAEFIFNKIIEDEKNEISNPYLSTRVMATIEQLEQENVAWTGWRVLRPALISLSMAASVFIGVQMGSLVAVGTSVPDEIAYMDDYSMEKIDNYINVNEYDYGNK